MKILVTGAGGFVGQHLIKKLLLNKYSVIAMDFAQNSVLEKYNIPVYNTNILNFIDVENVINKEQPNVIVHLAAQSNVGISWKSTNLTTSVNIEGSLNLYKAFFNINPQGLFLNIGSSDEYGLTAKMGIPLTEEMECKPQNPYSISKYCTEQLLLQLSKKDNVKLVSTRSFNHFGPGQRTGFVISDFASQIAKIKLGIINNEIYVGDLSAARDFLYIDDIINAYIAIIENSVPNGIYNISSGKSYKIQDILNLLINLSGEEIKINIDKNKFRPAEVSNFVGASYKLKSVTSWEAKTSLMEGLKKTLDYWYKKIGDN